MKNILLIVICVMSIVFLTNTQSHAAPVLDQSMDPFLLGGVNSHFIMYRGGYFAQTFTVGITGKLTQIDVLLSRHESMTDNVLFDLRPVDSGGVPLLSNVPADQLVNTAISYSSIPVAPSVVNYGFVTVDLSSFNIQVTAGDVLSIVLKRDTLPLPADDAQMWDIVWGARSDNPYPFGTAFGRPQKETSMWNMLVGLNGIPPDAGFRTYVDPTPVKEVAIDIKPGSDPNCFNQNERGVIPVAILGSADLDVKQIRVDSLSLQGLTVKTTEMTGKYLAHYDYVNGDAYLDLVVQFADSDSWTASETVNNAILTGALIDGTLIKGQDSICLVP